MHLTRTGQIILFSFALMALSACSGGNNGGQDPVTTYTVSATAGTNGSITPSVTTIDEGDTASFTITADSGYSIGTVSGCDGTLAGNTYTTGAITADCTVNASFVINSYAVSATAGNGGSIDPASADIDHGATASFTITPDAGYSIAAVSGCNGTLAGNTYTTGAITAACTVNASFGANSYTVSATAGNGGSIDPASTDVAFGGSTSFTVTPDTGYAIADVSGCNGTLAGNTYTTGPITAACTVNASFSANSYTVSATAGNGGSIDPASTDVAFGGSTNFTVTPDTGYAIADVSGCGGTLDGNTYTTGAITAACVVNASFAINTYTVSGVAGAGGSIGPASATVDHGSTTNFTVTVDSGYVIDNVSGCGVTLLSNGSTNTYDYISEPITADCTVNASFKSALELSFEPIKTFRFTWPDVPGAAYYKLLENPDGASGFNQIGGDIPQGTLTMDHIVPLYARTNAQYMLQTCDAADVCSDYTVMSVNSTMDSAIGYFKGRTSKVNDWFGYSVAISGDGNTLAIGASDESSNAVGIDGDEADNTGIRSGAVYVFVRDAAGAWSRQAYLKASVQQNNASFGESVDLSDNGNTLVVGTPSAHYPVYPWSGSAYVFTRSGTSWSQQAVLQASNAQSSDEFGTTVTISGDGNTVAVFASGEDSGATGTFGDAGQVSDAAQVAAAKANNSVSAAGAVYVFTFDSGTSTWSEQAYIKASNTGETTEWFGKALALSSSGDMLAVGAPYEDSNADGTYGQAGETTDGTAAEADNSAGNAGAVYMFALDFGGNWTQIAYIKASNSAPGSEFGWSLDMSADGTLAVGARKHGYQSPGAVYVFTVDMGTFIWSEQAIITPSNTPRGTWFGDAVALSADGNLLAVGHPGEYKGATGIGSEENNRLITGAVFTFTRSGGNWTQQTFMKAPNPDYDDRFGHALDLSANGDTLAVGAHVENSSADDIGGDQTSNAHSDSGAVYLY